MPQLGKYQLHEELGRGGFATVYLATHETLGTEVAVKVLNPALAGDEAARGRFVQEAQTASDLEHPHIVRIDDLDQDGEQVFLAMEYLPGGDLTSWLSQRGETRRGEILRMLGQVAQALDYAHAQGALHRDVKPTNILMDAEGNAHLCDFGLVRVADAPRLTRVGSVVGTASYVSPEQAESKPLDGRADQYSLAVVAYELFVGELPFTGEASTAISLMHVTKLPPVPSSLNPDVPPDVDEVLLKALAKEPDNRYATCAACIEALDGAWEASERENIRRLMVESRELLAQGDYTAMRLRLEEARKMLANRPEMSETLAELESARQSAQTYEQISKNWDTAERKARDVLELYPDFPDPQGIFVTLGLRKAPRELPPISEIVRQAALGLGIGLPAGAIILYLAFLYITR
ncbi:MAG: serine/threonine protein kinase [Anaerolineales bacterium]|nr:serine/threonine protein kinase [Anaerolineales bacterium]